MLKSGVTFLRLYFHKHQRCYTVFVNNTIVTDTKRVAEDGSLRTPDPKTEELHNKLLFSSYLESRNLSYGKRINYAANNAMFIEKREAYLEKQRTKPYPISLQYLIDDKQLLELDKSEEHALPETVQESSEFPYKLKDSSKIITNNPPATWMTDYDYFDDSKLQTEEKDDILTHTDHHNFNLSDEVDEDEYIVKMKEKQQMVKNYGTPAPDVPVSSVKCGGCGSLLHCKDTSIPGYVPSEIFIGRSIGQLREMHCQRCHFLKEYNIALNVAVDPEEYPKLLNQIKPKRALAVLMVDLLDFPCSIWPGIMDIIGRKRPIIIVGNKVDLLPEDSPGYLRHIEECLKMSVNNSSLSQANIKHVSLISAKTGFGVEELINKLHTIWKYSGDVYLIGCTNVGKSTLFNALLQSDYCKVEAVDLLQRATISPWPGTTLNLLKFPILKPMGWRLHLRSKRLFTERAEAHAELKLRRELARKTGSESLATLMGHIGRTFINPNKVVEPSNDPYAYQMSTGFTQSSHSRGISETGKAFAESKWCYDTPGVIHPDQILTILTIEELMLTLPKALIRPRTFHLQKGSTIFLAGLARLDFLECEDAVKFTVFTSKYLPITVCKTVNADELYSKLLGTEYFAVPRGNEERLSKWPALKCSEDMKAVGEGWEKSVADVILSSAGWISITGKTGIECTVRAWTPDGRGIHLREPSLIRYAADMRGKRIRGSPAYNIGKIYCKRDKIQFKI